MPKRRGNQEGSIYQISDGRWCAAISLGAKLNAEGKAVRARKVLTAQTREDVQKELIRELRNQHLGLPVSHSKQTLGQFLTNWLEDTVKLSVRPKTFVSYEQMVRNHLVKNIPAEQWKKKELDNVLGLGTVRLHKLRMERVQRFLTDKLNAGNSPSLVRYLRSVLRIALNQAVKADLIARNPAALATPPKVEKRSITPFTAEQAGRFLMAAQGHRLEALFTVALAVGIRSGEACGLRWAEDVDLDHGTITIHHALQRQKGKGLVLVPPKSDASRRTIELPGVCVAALRTHRQRRQFEKEWAGSSWKETGYVFTTSIGTPLDDRRILQEFIALVEAAKLPRQRFHDLRHACISLLAAQGVPDKVIADTVGHSDVRLTKEVYQHVYQPARRAAADKMSELLTRVTGRNSEPVANTVANKPAPHKAN